MPVQAEGLKDLRWSDATSGLKKALALGAETAITLLGQTDGFMGNAQVRIALPDAFNKGSRWLRRWGKGQALDDLVLQMNRAAVAAEPMSKGLILQAIHAMEVKDAKQILGGGATSAPQFFESKTQSALAVQLKPEVAQVLGRMDLVKQFNAISGQLASLVLLYKDKLLLEDHVTDKALAGVYWAIGEEEKKMRQNSAKTGNALLEKVLGDLI